MSSLFTISEARTEALQPRVGGQVCGQGHVMIPAPINAKARDPGGPAS